MVAARGKMVKGPGDIVLCWIASGQSNFPQPLPKACIVFNRKVEVEYLRPRIIT